MRRREFIKATGALILGSSTRAYAQQRAVPVVAFLVPTTEAIARDRVDAFAERLRKLGWEPGKTVALDYRWANGDSARFSPLAAELIQRKPDVIVTWGTATALAAKRATSTIPIVFTIVGDPVGSGLVASLRRPGANVTGFSTEHPDAAGKRLELFNILVPRLRRLAILGNAQNSGSISELYQIRKIAHERGIDAIPAEFHEPSEIPEAIAAVQGLVDALYVTSDAVINNSRAAVTGLALKARLPTVAGFREFVAAGGLMSYAPDFIELFRQTADYVDKVLRGARPGDLPVEQPTRFELIINRKTATGLGLTIPPSLLTLADDVIE